MALIDVVRHEANDKELVYRFPTDNLCLGSQLVVYQGQLAYFVKGGKVLDEFETGTHTLKSENIPLLNKLVNLPFGGNSPFKAEVWFVNLLAILNGKWGTPTPLQLEDPKYEIVVPVRAFGQYGIRIAEPRKFLEKLVGNQRSFSVDKLNEYFRGRIITLLNTLIAEKMVKDNISILTINTKLTEISEYVHQELNPHFQEYGVELENFFVMSINVPEDDPSFVKLKEAKDLAARLKITGKDVYQMERSFNVLDKAAVNEGGGNNMLNAGLGIGAGIGVGGQVGNMVAQTMNTNIAPPPLPTAMPFYVAVNGQQAGPYDFNALAGYVQSGQITGDTLVWKQGMAAWTKASMVMELSSLFAQCPPPLPPLP